MGQPFPEQVAGQGGALIIDNIHSPNFVHGSSGWSIDQNGNAEFNSIILPPGSSVTITFAASAPASPATGDLWYNTSAGLEVSQWNGSAWVAYQIGAGAITPGSITASLIQANTITASQLAAGIVYAGIINGTTVSAATFNGSVFNGTDFTINSTGAFFYSGTPAGGNLVLSVTQTSGTDPYGNAYLQGFTTYATFFGGYFAMQNSVGVLQFATASGYGGPYVDGASITIDSSGEITIDGTGLQVPSSNINGYAVSFAFLSTIGQMSHLSAPGGGFSKSGIGTISGTPTAAEFNALNTSSNNLVDGVNALVTNVSTLLTRLQNEGYMA